MAERKYKHPQVNLRLPEELKEKVAEIAAKNGRSSNAEMVAAIEYWVTRSADHPNELRSIHSLREDTRNALNVPSKDNNDFFTLQTGILAAIEILRRCDLLDDDGNIINFPKNK